MKKFCDWSSTSIMTFAFLFSFAIQDAKHLLKCFALSASLVAKTKCGQCLGFQMFCGEKKILSAAQEALNSCQTALCDCTSFLRSRVAILANTVSVCTSCAFALWLSSANKGPGFITLFLLFRSWCLFCEVHRNKSLKGVLNNLIWYSS